MFLLLLHHLFIFFLLWPVHFSAAATAAVGECLKLPLLHKAAHPTAAQALSLDTRRLAALSTKSPLISGASTGAGQYLVSVRVGTPPQRLLLVADTGSDLIWVRCSACRNCTAHPLGTSFLARHSSSFRPHHCYDAACRLVPQSETAHLRCNNTRRRSSCSYEYSYSDGSSSAGLFSSETTTVKTSSNRAAKLGLNFGCGFRSYAAGLGGAQGVLGLGRGPISFSTQLGRRFGHKFSYCLMDYTLSPPQTSYLVIGGAPNSAAGNVKMNFTPLLVNPLSPTFYYINILAVHVDGAKLEISRSVWALDDLGNGGTIVDSGTTLTFLPETAYSQVLAAMRRRVAVPETATPTLGFDLCLNVSGEATPRFPRLSFELEGGSEVSPPARNYFIDTVEGVKCLAVQAVSTEAGFSVIGNLMQQGFLFEFDRERSRLGFSRHGCAVL